MHLACQKNSATSKLSGNGRKDPNLPLPLSFGASKFFWQAKCIIAKEQFFFIAFGLPKKFGNTKTQW
ncbi:unnamed protein product [Blepharisma stoltei]|uniref:Ribosomal protein L32 n=1 Tax=Blepharisma stoltei TaxID=1481888 RepID=A0AAU9J3W7_9CILI|nr:unnamed protein product [Blepharisma stoltei]